MRWMLVLFTVLMCAGPLLAAGRPMTIDDLLAVKTVGDPQISPDGKLVVYVVSEIDRATDKSSSDLWLAPVDGGEPRRLTTAPGKDEGPRWSPDGKTIAFTSTRSGSSQIWLLPLEGGEATQLTKLPIDVSGPIWSPKGDRLAFTAEVFPGTDPAKTAERDKQRAESKSKAMIFDSLMVRHWTSWNEGKKSHLFVCDAKTGEAKDLTPKFEVNVPPGPFGGSNEYAWSPDGAELAFSAEPAKDHAWSTNTDIWTVAAGGGEPKNITGEFPGGDAQPSYSPDGGLIAWLNQSRAGFEADQWVLTVRDRKTGHATRLESIDRPIQGYAWVRDPRDAADRSWAVLATLDRTGREPLVEIGFYEEGAGFVVDREMPRTIVDGGTNTSATIGDSPEPPVAFIRGTADRPGEVHTVAWHGGTPTRLTNHNTPLMASLDVAKAEEFTFSGAEGDEVHGWLIKPPGFDPSKKYPVLFLIHGGPQGAWHDEWHGRWNYQLFAAPGYAVVAINPRGSTGYGQKFTDQISGDWTGRVYEDLLKGLDHALASYPFLDRSHMAAAGGSYGGFMVNWIAGHADRFRCLISHAGVFDLTSKYGTTEELWFPEWEFGGTPWDKPEIYREQSPSSFVKHFKTPTLVTHGALDFRVPDAQGLGMFTALQRRGVPSRYVFFPDEGHWILKPANRVVWWREMHDWLGKYLKS